MAKIVECVPNFSEGKDLLKIKQITDAIEAVNGIKLLSVEPGADTNRTVVTFIGSPEAVTEAAFIAIQKASIILDMSKHKGAHPRMGATDVCPFIPVNEVTMTECVQIARNVAARVGKELEIPVYLYEEAAQTPNRKSLSDIRRGEYEGLEEKLKDPQWKPDFGPTKFNARAGATVLGAREFLIAYNVTLNSIDKKHAEDIAGEIRETGRVARSNVSSQFYLSGDIMTYRQDHFPCGNCDFVGVSFAETKKHCHDIHQYDLSKLMKDNQKDPLNPIGQRVYKSGKFQNCKAIGWYVDEFKRAQVSINLTNYKVTSMHSALEEVRSLASERGLVVTGSEIVGLVPYQALYEAGKFYLEKQGKPTGVPHLDILRTAVYSLGLNDVAPFEIEKKVLGLPKVEIKALSNLTINNFADEVSRDTPAPGGGSIAALAGSLGAALTSMVATLSHGKKGFEKKKNELDQIAVKSQEIKSKLLTAIDDDTNAFNAYIEAVRLPQKTNEEKKHREQKMLEGMKIAIEVPMNTALLSYEAIQLARRVAEIGNPNSITDAAVGAQIGFTGVRGGIWNVMVNLKDVSEKDYVEKMRANCTTLLKSARSLLIETEEFVDIKLEEMIKNSKK